MIKGGFKSEDIEEFFRCQSKYSKSWAENLNKLFTVLGGKFKFSAQDSVWNIYPGSEKFSSLFWLKAIFRNGSELVHAGLNFWRCIFGLTIFYKISRENIEGWWK